jgi:hypothetical protein
MVSRGREGQQYTKPFSHVLKYWEIFRSPISIIKLHTNYSLVKEFQVHSHKEPRFLHRGDNHKNAKIRLVHSRIFYSRTTKPEKLRFT